VTRSGNEKSHASDMGPRADTVGNAQEQRATAVGSATSLGSSEPFARLSKMPSSPTITAIDRLLLAAGSVTPCCLAFCGFKQRPTGPDENSIVVGPSFDPADEPRAASLELGE
jgi:hypothetical protein